MPKSFLIPNVIEQVPGGERAYDIYSRLLKDRIIMLGTDFNDGMASSIVSQLLFLDNQDNTKPIKLYINSPGGQVTSGLAIYDTMQYIKSPVHTLTMGLAASMGSFIATAGEAGHRYILPNAEYMVHQPSGGAQGTQTDIVIRANHITRMREKLERIYEKHNAAGKTYEDITKLMQGGDQWLDPEEAIEWGFLDKILTKSE